MEKATASVSAWILPPWQVVPDDEEVIFASMRLAACWVGMTGIA